MRQSRRVCVPALYFHHVSDRLNHYTNCPPQAFISFMEYIAARYTTVTPSKIHSLVAAGLPLPQNPLLITFDDGYADNLDVAIPTLQRLSCTATIFVISDYVGRTSDWNARDGRQWHMDFPDLAALSRSGFEIGSHTRSHRVLTGLDRHELEGELAGSRSLLEDKLGVSIDSLAYPYGAHDAAVCEAAQATYRVAFSTVKSQHIDWCLDPHSLRRAYIESDQPPESIDRVVSQYSNGSIELRQESA